MAENEPLTPEKQLLKLIENPKQEVLAVEGTKREGKKWVSFSAFKGRFAFWKSFSVKGWFSFKRLTKSSLRLRQVNLILRVLIVLLVLFLGAQIVTMGLDLKKASNLMLQPEKGAAPELEQSMELKNISYYLEKMGSRNIFSGVEPPKPNVVPEPPKPAAEHDRTKDFSLVGISWSANPEAMIEDTLRKRTFFVKRGQSLDGSVRVVTVFKDRVILTIDGKEFELK